MKFRATCPRLRLFASLALLMILASPLFGQEKRPSREDARPRNNRSFVEQLFRSAFNSERPAGRYERRHSSVVSAFREVVADPSKSTVVVISDLEPVALGAIVSPYGHILTKASDLKGKLVCKLTDNRRLEAELVGSNKQHDLALLKIDASGLTPIVWSDQSESPVGSWLATPGLSADPISIGVVSASPRGIASPRPILGVLLAQSDLGARIDEIMPGSGADQAKLQVGDVIMGVNDEEIKTRESLIQRIGQFQAGDTVKLQVRRGEESLKIDATLGPIDDEMSQINRHDFQNHLGGDLSRRRAGFPSVFQHDSILQPNECGGPVVDLNGHAVGVNIARAGRVASYAIPASVAKEVLASLMNAKPVSIQDEAKMH
jgi:serine protease Do